MVFKSLGVGGLLLALGAFAAPASAAPISSVNGVTAGVATSAAEKASYRRCWWHNGHRRCRWVDDDYSYYGYGDGYYGYGPGVGVFIGGRGGHGGRGHGDGGHGRGRH